MQIDSFMNAGFRFECRVASGLMTSIMKINQASGHVALRSEEYV